MSKLPNADKAIVPKEKITIYLLNPEHKTGGDKAAFFLRFGFSIDNWQVMENALLSHARAHNVTNIKKTPFCHNYSIEGALTTPDERHPQVRTVWCVRHNDTDAIPYFVTAYPLDK